MTNLLTVLPDFDLKPYTHLLPSLEKALILTADLLTLDAFDIGKRASLPPGEVRKLTDALLEALHLAISASNTVGRDGSDIAASEVGKDGLGSSSSWTLISTLDDSLDASLGGGISPGYLTEIVGER